MKSGYDFRPARTLRDRYIDSVTYNFARTPDGAWHDSPDSRSIVIIAINTELDGSPYDPSHGTSVGRLIEAGGLIQPETLQAEAARVGQDLAEEGILSGLEIRVRAPDGSPLRDSEGRDGVALLRWRELASGASVETIYRPEQEI